MSALSGGRGLAAVAALLLAWGASPASAILVDNFEGADIVRNTIGNRANVFLRQPSKAMAGRRLEIIEGQRTRILMLRYDRRTMGGPFDSGGWCGYYTLLKTAKAVPGTGMRPELPGAVSEEYFDASDFHAITFWVRGREGNENFVVGVADRHWDRVGDSVKSQPVGHYLPQDRITTQWQKAVIPLEEFFLDYTQLASIAIVFEGDLFPEAGAIGTVYLDEIQLE